MKGERVSREDLDWAALWLESYEGDDGVPARDSPDSGDECVQRARRVAAWIDAEVARRDSRKRARR